MGGYPVTHVVETLPHVRWHRKGRGALNDSFVCGRSPLPVRSSIPHGVVGVHSLPSEDVLWPSRNEPLEPADITALVVSASGNDMSTTKSDENVGAAFNPNAVRCNAQSKRTGRRCRNPARRGYSVCSHHGAGFSLRPGGRPPVHSLSIRREDVVVRAVARRYGRSRMDEYESLVVARAMLELSIEKLDTLIQTEEATFADFRYVLEMSDKVARLALRLARRA